MVQLSALQWPNVVGDQRIFSELIEAQVLVDCGLCWSATWGISGRVVWAIVNKAFTACGPTLLPVPDLALHQALWCKL